MPDFSDKNKKVPMPEQDPLKRSRNFDEVSLGYSEELAVLEAQRCLKCKNAPCMSGCPVNVRIPEFIHAVAEGRFGDAYETIRETNSLPAVCGRVCPQETQCESLCVRGRKGEPVGIGRLERFAADFHIRSGGVSGGTKAETPLGKVAVVGSGPAGLTCAGDLARLNYDVTVFEAFHVAGGVLMYGIPEFRLPKALVQKEIESVRELGVKIETNMVIGKVFSVEELFERGFEAVFIGSGAGLPVFMGIPGENLGGVYSANEFLTRVNLMKAYRFPETDTPIRAGKHVAVVGGGNVAMDAARCAKRLGAEEVSVIYRRTREEMPARREEIRHAGEEGIRFHFLENPVRILGEKYVRGIECVRMELGEPDASGRRRPVAIKGSEHLLDADTVIIAIGTAPNPLIRSTTPGLETQKRGGIAVRGENGETSLQGVFAGGDAVTGSATVILAMGAGKKAAKAIDEYLKSRKAEALPGGVSRS